jgi:phosphoglycerate dehydrogenase-like enzyme
MQRDQQAGRWRELAHWEKEGEIELRGRTIGSVGYGVIGSEVGRLAGAFGMIVLAVRRHPNQKRSRPEGMLPGTDDLEGAIPERTYQPGPLRDILPGYDVVVLTLPLTAETEGLVGREEIGIAPG